MNVEQAADAHRDVSRRTFLRTAIAPLGAMLVGACGGGSEGEGNSQTGTAPPTTDPPSTAPPTPSGSVPSWVASLPLWQWYEIPNTALASVDPAVRPLGITGPHSKIDAWCGASLRRRGSVYMIGAAGGHADYAGNEVNVLALNAETPAWVEVRGPTPNEYIVGSTQFYLDHRPSSAHTYYATQFIDALDRMIVFASLGIYGTIYPPAPAGFPYVGSARSFSFNVAAGDWDPPDYVAQYPGLGDWTAALCAKHPWTGDVYYSRNYSAAGWYRWSPATNAWSRLSNVSRDPWFAGSAIDPVRDRMLVVGGGKSLLPPEVHYLDGSRAIATFSGLGATALSLTGYPGVIYDEALDCYLVASNSDGGIKILRVDAANWSVDDPKISGDVPKARTNGIQNSIQYVPELKGFVLANSHSGNVWFVRTAA